MSTYVNNKFDILYPIPRYNVPDIIDIYVLLQWYMHYVGYDNT